MEETVARLDRLMLNHVVEPLPVLHPARRQPTPCLRLCVEDLRAWRIVTLRVRIHLELRECLLRALWIGVSQAYAEKDVDGRRVTNGVASHVVWYVLPWCQNEILA